MYELGKTVWSDEHPELYGEVLDFDALGAPMGKALEAVAEEFACNAAKR